MKDQNGLRSRVALIAALALAVVLVACGSDDEETTGGGDAASNLIEKNAENKDVAVTIGSKKFAEQIILGEIYAQALEAAGYGVSTQLNLGSEQIALKALEDEEITGYPEYTSTALTSFFDFDPEDVPAAAGEAREETQRDFEKLGLVAYGPTNFESANAVGTLRETAQKLGLERISDLKGQSEDLTLAGSPECRQRIDCLLGLQKYYGLEFAEFTPVDIGLRYEALDNKDADLSILFTTDANLSESDDYVTLVDDKDVLPAGNVIFIANRGAAEEAGPDFAATIEKVQGDLSLEVMQELNARVEIDNESEEDVARKYLKQFGYVE